MSLQLYNTLTRRKEAFAPIDPSNVRMYVCGPTVYDFAHIGNARPIIVFDVLFRLLRHIYGDAHVTYARNITDVDDKINNRAVERFPEMEPTAAIRRLTGETADQFHRDIAALGVLPPTVEPRATEHIAEMRDLCEALVTRGHAYVAQDHVLFDASSMADYGRLANRSLEEMEAGARVDVAPYKRGPMDFVLWKPSSPAQPGWPSPCGIATPGRPGWHIECSAMADRWLWSEPRMKGMLSEAGLARPHVFDIHGGGIDLVFPHHENEIAQSRCAHGTPVMANYWMHNGFLQVEGEKMSKSLGNFVTINELLRDWPGDVIRVAMLLAHYRSPLDWTASKCTEVARELCEWGKLIGENFENSRAHPCEDLLAALSDDLNTPQALAVLRRQFGEARRGDVSMLTTFGQNCKFLGLRSLSKPGYFESGVLRRNVDFGDIADHVILVRNLRAALANNDREAAKSLTSRLKSNGLVVEENSFGQICLVGNRADFSEHITERVNARLEARKRKDFAESDRIRDELATMGIALKDSKNKATGEIETTWEVRASATTEVKR